MQVSILKLFYFKFKYFQLCCWLIVFQYSIWYRKTKIEMFVLRFSQKYVFPTNCNLAAIVQSIENFQFQHHVGVSGSSLCSLLNATFSCRFNDFMVVVAAFEELCNLLVNLTRALNCFKLLFYIPPKMLGKSAQHNKHFNLFKKRNNFE